jgi:hypothetical protein
MAADQVRLSAAAVAAILVPATCGLINEGSFGI